jgi:hypothetical protein
MSNRTFVLSMTAIVLIAGFLVTAHGADLAVPRKGSGFPDSRCYTAARYEAMREAYERRLPDPCSGARTWVR